MNKAWKRVGLTLKDKTGETRQVTVTTLGDEEPLRYRAWVNANRQHVHAVSNGQLGYVHVPDMSEVGYGEFFRAYQLEHLKSGLVVDFRFNGGGSVSSLILQVLSRPVKGWDVSPWHGTVTYPLEAVAGPKVAITNQFAASDGDMIGHAFRLYGLGPLVGKRSWGGVIGICPTHKLVDGTVVTVPEFGSYFVDIGWDLENRGAVPDYDVDITPQDYREGKDPQLDKAIELAMKSLSENPVKLPDFSQRPRKPIPTALGRGTANSASENRSGGPKNNKKASRKPSRTARRQRD